MSAHDRALDDGAPDWSFDDATAFPFSLDPRGEGFPEARGDDLDLDRLAVSAETSRPPAFANRRRAHAISAVGAGLAVALALLVHSLTQSPSYAPAGAGATTPGSVAQPLAGRRETRVLRPGAARRNGRRRRARRSRVPAVAPRPPVVRAAVVDARAPSGNVRPGAEFGFEE